MEPDAKGITTNPRKGDPMRRSVRFTFDQLEGRDLCTMVGPQYFPGVIRGHHEIEVYAPGAHLIEAIMVAKDIQETQGGPMPSRGTIIVKP